VYLEENLGGDSLQLTQKEIETLNGATGEQGVSGPRYIEKLAAMVDR
jgi:hypothetical protein